MIVNDPEVTLEEEGHGFPEEARDTAMMGWNLVTAVHGDDGHQYWFNIGAMSMREGWGDLDFWQMCIRSGKGRVVQPTGSVYKVADFPQGIATEWHVHPRGALTTTTSTDHVAVDLGDLHIVCKPADKTWHYTVEDKEAGISGEWVHTGNGHPMWYGKETPQAYTAHSISYGYIWSGTVEGTLTIQGRTVRVTGAGQRERYYAVDACPAEVGAWHDWMWFHFDEMSGNLDEMKDSKHKDMSLYLVDEKQYIPAGDFAIEHHDWAFDPTSGVFIPTRYQVTIETEAGVLEIAAKTVSCYTASGIGDPPDSPTMVLDWDKVDGTFTYNDGGTKTLKNGLGGTLIRQWKPYPSVLIAGAELQAQDVPRV
jgi:hypothetical protein